MLLSPDEVESKQFVTVMRGYDPAEVHDFLGRVAHDVRRLLRAVFAADPAVTADVLPELDELLRHGEGRSDEIIRLAAEAREATVDAAGIRRAAQESARADQTGAREARLSAVREAADILARARQEAVALVEDAQRQRREILADVRRLDAYLGRVADEAAVLRQKLRTEAPDAGDEVD